MFNIEVISSPSASSVSIFGIFTSRLSDFQVRVDAGDARRQELGTAPATSKVVVRIQKHHHTELQLHRQEKIAKCI